MVAHHHIGSSCFDICSVTISWVPFETDMHWCRCCHRCATYLSQACAILDCAAEPTLITFMGSMPGMVCGWRPSEAGSVMLCCSGLLKTTSDWRAVCV